MIIHAKLKCDKDHVPYRIFINDELICERYYTISTPKTISNDLSVTLIDADDYDIKLQNLSDTEVRLVDWSFTKGELHENT